MTKIFRIRNENSFYFDLIGTLNQSEHYIYDPYGNDVMLDFLSLGDFGLWFAREEIEELDQ